jgi:PLD-like domain
MPSKAKPFAAVQKVIAARGAALAALPGVVEVWAGYKFRKGRITDTPALMVSVLKKTPQSKLKKPELLPAKLDGVPVDVVPASPAQLLQFAAARGPALTAKSAAGLAGMVAAAAPGAGIAAAGAPLIPYVPATPPLKVVDEKMTLVCHASPDAGWRLLSGFFGRTKSRLTATMYEFTAEHILKTLRGSLTAPRKLEFIMDGGTPENEEARAALKSSLAARMKFVWAAVADSGKVTKAFFPTAYHIKVAVRDGREFWLSSGNWKTSNQPERDPIGSPFPTAAKADAFHRKQNRDWHVVVDNAALAEQFERFIRHDMAQAKPLQGQPPAAAAALAAVKAKFDAPVAIADTGGVEFFEEQVFDKKLRVMPLLTPDNYADAVLPLIKGAKKRILFQNQSLSASITSPKYRKLAEALRDKSKSTKVKVQIIVRGDFDPHRILSNLKAFGFNMACVRLMRGNHTKGILIDDAITVIGSHNWTGQGTTQNRDASLIIHDAEVTAYWTKLFQHDWKRRSNAAAPSEPALAAVAAGAAAPAGKVRLTAREILDGCPPDLF